MAEKKLYKVEVSGVIYVYAKDDYDAECIARGAVRDETHNMEYWASGTVSRLASVDYDWRNSIPYGEENDRSVQKILEQEVAVEE